MVLFVLTLSACLLSSIPAFATTCGGVETSILECDEGGDGGITHILKLVTTILSIGIGIVGVIGISVAGVQYLTAGGNEEKTRKAKRRIYEVVLGVVAYVVIFSVIAWLLPGSTASQTGTGQVTTKGPTKMSISYSGKTTTSESFQPKVTFEGDVADTTYSLISGNKEIATTFGNGVRCVAEGKTTITAIAADGSRASMDVNCKETRYADDNSPSTNTSHNPAGSKSKTAPDGSVAASDGSGTTGSQANVKMNHDDSRMRKATRQVISDHNKDFYYNTYDSYIKKNFGGSFVKYVQSLKTQKGNDTVFSVYAGRLRTKGEHAGIPKLIKVETAADFQAAVEYVWGLYDIWGPDYANGRIFWAWGGHGSTTTGTDDSYYQGLSPRWNTAYSQGNINTVLPANVNIRTGCNLLVNSFYLSTNLTRIGGSGSYGQSSLQATLSRQNGVKSADGKIHYVDELKVGDLLNFPGHVAMVGEVYKDYVIVYDGGSRYITTRVYKKKIPRKHTTSLAGTTYGGYSYWFGTRPWKIDQSVTLQGLNPE